MKSTLEQLESLEEIVQFSSWPEVRKKLDVVLKRLESYEVGKYSDWRNKVSDILDQNLGKHLIRREEAADREEGEEESKVGRFVVNFTSDLSDTFAEAGMMIFTEVDNISITPTQVINMEKIGFKVPEVAKNMSMQEAKLLDIADQLGRWPAKK